MIDVKKTSGQIIASVEPSEGSKRKFMLMKEDYVLLKFSLSSPIVFGLGSYIETTYGRFEICDEQRPSYNTNTGGYDYGLRFDAEYWKWKNKIFKFTPEAGGQEASWNLTATLDVQLGVFLRNLKALGYSYNGVDYIFSIDSSVENKAVLMSYDNTNLLDALFSMASKEKWNCDCWITDNVIHFGRCEFGDAVKVEQAVNAEITSSESKGAYATRVYAFGGTKNIPQNYRPTDENVVVNGIVQKRLMLPAGTPYVDAYRYHNGKRVYLGEADYVKGTPMPQEEAIEDVIVMEEVFPKTVGTMSGITTKEYTDKIENQDGTTTEKKWNAYRYKDSSLQFSKDYILPGQELSIYFQSGRLNGMVFAVTFNPDGKPEKLKDGSWNTDAQLWEIVRNETYGRPLPDEVLKPADGDKFVLTGFDTKLVGDAMVPEAEQKLKTETEKYVKRTMMDDGTYTATMYPSWVYEDEINRTFGIGQKINLVAPELFKEGRVSRVIGYEFCLDIPYDHPAYTIGESAAYSRIGELEDKVESLTYKGQTYEGSSGSGVYVIRTNDSTPASDSNVYSALRVFSEFQKLNDRFLRKDRPDQTAHLLKLLGGLVVDGRLAELSKGAAFGNYQKKQSGACIDGTGLGEMKKLLVREGIESTDYNAGALGTGFVLKTDPETGRSYLEVDELLVRIIAVFVELEIRKLSYAGGNWVFSAAGGKCARVEELSDRYRCYLVVDDGNAAVENEFRVYDQVQCREFNIKSGVHENVSNRYYWRLVIGVGEDFIDLSKSDCDKGSVAPAKGDAFVQLGNRRDVKRQNAIVISSYGEGSPSITQHKGIDSYSLAGTEKTRISPDKNVFTGELHFESGVSVEESVNHVGNTASAAQSAASAAQGTANIALSKVETLRTETKSSIDALNGKISLKVDSSIFNSLKQQVQTQGSELQLAKDEIKAKVSQSTFDAEKEKQNILAACNDANMITDDPSFARGVNGIVVYNSANSGAVTITRKAGCSVNSSNYYLDIITAATGAVGPGYGGFSFQYQTKARLRLVCRFSAWLDKGRRFEFATNATGNNSRHFWLTDNQGKGTWADYAYYVECGTGGSFSTTFFFYVMGGNRRVSTWLSYATIHMLSADADFKHRLSTTETSISLLNDKIALKAEKTQMDGINNRLQSAEHSLQPDQIWMKVSERVNQVVVDKSKRKSVVIDALSLNQNTYYPVVFFLNLGVPQYRIKVYRVLGEAMGIPSWCNNAVGFSLMVSWLTNASGRGNIDVKRIIEESTHYHSYVPPVGSIGQLGYSSCEYIYVRGGSRYNIEVEGDSSLNINLYTGTFTSQGQSVSPVSSVVWPEREQPTREEIKAGIGVTTGGVTVFGKTISLNGVVTFSSLKQGSDGQSIIEGGKIKTNLINVKSLFAEEITATRFNLAGGSIGGFKVEGISLVNNKADSYINLGNDATKFVRINYQETMIAVRAQGTAKGGVSIYTQGAGYTALSISAQGYSTAIHSAGGHEFLQRQGETWNAPGVLWAAKLNENGAIIMQWGNGLGKVSVATGRRNAGHYYITHNLGRSDYFAMVTSELGRNNTRTSACVKDITSNGFSVQITNMGDNYIDAGIFVCIIGRNKW